MVYPTRLPILEIDKTFKGRKYKEADYQTVWNITVTKGAFLPADDLLDFLFKNVTEKEIQSKEEWKKNLSNDELYRSGYYYLQETPTGYRFTVTKPYEYEI